LIEAKNEAETILNAVGASKKKAAWQQLSSDETQTIEAAITELKASVMGGNYKIIRMGIERLDKATRRLADVMMDMEVMGAMKGKTMGAAGESMGDGPSAPHPFAKAEFDEDEDEDKEVDEDEDEEV